MDRPVNAQPGGSVYVSRRAIPTTGWVIELLIVVFGLGAIWIAFRDGRVARESAEMTDE